MALAKIKPSTFDELAMNVFMLVSEFDPATFDFNVGIDGTTILASTTGGITFVDTPEYTDMGDDIDNCPKNTMELKHKEDGEITLSGTLVTFNLEMLKTLLGAASLSGNKATPRPSLAVSDFIPKIWGITDYGDGGLVAICMKRVLNTSGFSITTSDQSKATITFTFTCHKTLYDLEDPPYEIYILTPDSTLGSVTLSRHSATIAVNDTVLLTANTIPSGKTVTWASDDTSIATVSDGTVTGVAAGNTIISASITHEGVVYNDTCTIIVEE